MKKMMSLMSVLVLAACADTGSATHASANACQRWQEVKTACSRSFAGEIGMSAQGQIVACIRQQGFTAKPQGC